MSLNWLNKAGKLLIKKKLILVKTVSSIYFFRKKNKKNNYVKLARGYKFEMWKPTLCSPWPTGTSPLIGIIWLFFHVFHFFSNKEYTAGIIRSGARVVHRTVAFPRYFRFPFMGVQDIQFGALWTEKNHRGKGLASFTCCELVRRLSRPRRHFWYLTNSENAASQAVARRSGFTLVDRGERDKKFGLSILGHYSRSYYKDRKIR